MYKIIGFYNGYLSTWNIVKMKYVLFCLKKSNVFILINENAT